MGGREWERERVRLWCASFDSTTAQTCTTVDTIRTLINPAHFAVADSSTIALLLCIIQVERDVDLHTSDCAGCTLQNGGEGEYASKLIWLKRNIAMRSTVLRCTTLYCVVLNCTELHCTVYYTILHYTVLHCTVPA